MPAIFIELWAVPIVLLLLGSLIWAAFAYGRTSAMRRWRTVFARLPLGVLLFDTSGKRTFENRAAASLLEQFDVAQLEQLTQSVAQGAPRGTIVRGRDGAVVRVQGDALNGRGSDVLVTLHDIASQQAAEANYRKFIHTLSHELLTPLTAIQGHLANIKASSDAETAPWGGSLRVVQDEVERLTRLTSNLLILSRLEAGQPLQRRPTNLSAIVEEAVLSLLEKADARQTTLNIEADPQLARPSIDRDAWKQVFLNLIDNAIKYGRQGGTVNVVLRQDGSRILASVADDGPGIAPADLLHLFDELFRADDQRHVSGSGLGLAIVKRIVERHDGQINVASEPGHGTTFHITLPLNDTFVTSP